MALVQSVFSWAAPSRAFLHAPLSSSSASTSDRIFYQKYIPGLLTEPGSKVYTLSSEFNPLFEVAKMSDRGQRGLALAALYRIEPKDGKWLVPSQTGNGERYEVD